MNVNKLSICNMALAILGQVDLSSLTEENQPARLCNQYYDIVRQQLLRAHDWDFARSREKLVLLETEKANGKIAYVYAKPAKCLFISKIYNEGRLSKPSEFFMEYRKSSNTEVIVSEIEEAYCEYTRDIEDVSLFDSLFVDAFSAGLATKIAMSLTGSTTIYQVAFQTYNSLLDNARYSNKVEKLENVLHDNPFLEARG